MSSGVKLTSATKTLSGTYGYVYGPASGTYSITNLGTVAATGNKFPGAIYLKNGGTVTNGGAAAVTGFGSNSGIVIVGAPGAVTNFGTIDGGATGRGVQLYDGGSLVNGTNAVIRGHGTGSAVFVSGTTAGIPNTGTTSGGGGGNGIVVASGLTAAAASTVTNYGTIDGKDGVAFSTIAGAATVINGSTADTSALIAGGAYPGATGVYIGGPNGGAIFNFATIGGPAGGSGVYLGTLAGAVSITNGSTGDTAAAILGNAADAAVISKKFVTIANFGTIADPADRSEIYLFGGASITNGSDSDRGALMVAAGSGIHAIGTLAGLTLANYGTIANTGSSFQAIYDWGGTITNGSPADTGALIEVATAGSGILVNGKLPGPITNFGTILGGNGIFFSTAALAGTVINAGMIASSNGTGGNAIVFGQSGDRLVVDPGAAFVGHVNATGGGNLLELASGASTGVLNGLSQYFSGFNTVTVDAGATWDLAGASTLGAGATLAVAGDAIVADSLAGYGAVQLNGGTAKFAGGLAASIGVSMTGPRPSILVVPGTAGGSLANAISGVAIGDRIEVAGVPFYDVTVNGSQLQLSIGDAPTFTLDDVSFAGTAAPHFKFGIDLFNSSEYIEMVACFVAGTRILTVAGELPVEAVRVGMLAPSLAHARPLRVRWVGHRRVDCAAHPRPLDVWPVRIAAHAVAPGVPHRDLLVSPDHALALPDGRGGTALVPARCLVNGVTIVQEKRDAVWYWHVELERHGVLVAEGLAAESYLDTGNRGAFAKAGGRALGAEWLPPDFAPLHPGYEDARPGELGLVSIP